MLVTAIFLTQKITVQQFTAVLFWEFIHKILIRIQRKGSGISVVLFQEYSCAALEIRRCCSGNSLVLFWEFSSILLGIQKCCSWNSVVLFCEFSSDFQKSKQCRSRNLFPYQLIKHRYNRLPIFIADSQDSLKKFKQSRYTVTLSCTCSAYTYFRIVSVGVFLDPDKRQVIACNTYYTYCTTQVSQPHLSLRQSQPISLSLISVHEWGVWVVQCSHAYSIQEQCAASAQLLSRLE